MRIDEFLGRLGGGRKGKDGQWMAKCPCGQHKHEDKTPSLAVGIGEKGKILLHCKAGSTAKTVIEAMGLTFSDLFADNGRADFTAGNSARRDGKSRIRPREVQRWPYHWKTKEQAFERARMEPGLDGKKKSFIFIPSGLPKETLALPYALPRIQKQPVVFVVEGEAKADKLWDWEIPATCSSSGASSWNEGPANWLKDAGVERVVVLPDNDKAGRKYAQDVRTTCLALGISVKIVELPRIEKDSGGDILDWDGTKEELLALAAAAPDETRQPGEDPPEEEESESLLETITKVENQPEPEWVMEDFLAKDSVSVIYGPAGVKKSFMAQHIIWCLCCGISCLKKLISRPMRVGYALGEGRSTLKHRFHAWLKYWSNGPLGDLRPRIEANFIRLKTIPDLSSDEDVARWKKILSEINPPLDVLVIDPWSHALGSLDALKEQDTRRALRALMELQAAASGAAILLVHHVPKDATRGLLGSVQLRNHVLLALELKKENQKDFSLHCNKARETEELPDIFMRSEVVDLGTRPDGKPLSSLIVFQRSDSELALGQDKTAMEILKAIHATGDKGIRRNDLEQDLDMNLETLKSALQRLKKAGLAKSVKRIWRWVSWPFTGEEGSSPIDDKTGASDDGRGGDRRTGDHG